MGNISSNFFFSFADEVKRGPWDHLVPMFTNCQIKEATQVGHHVNQLDGRSLNVYNVFNSVSDVYEYLDQHEHQKRTPLQLTEVEDIFSF